MSLLIEHRVILSLCDYSGEWSRPYREAGYDVRQIDMQLDGRDVRLMEHPGPVYGILAAPPCTMFGLGGAHLWAKRTEAEMLTALSVVDACLRLVMLCQPTFWALENPKGRLTRWLGAPAYTFQPFWFGNAYTKMTHLWGKFNPPRPSAVAETPPRLRNGYVEMISAGNGMSRQSRRSVTPAGFAKAFMEANP